MKQIYIRFQLEKYLFFIQYFKYDKNSKREQKKEKEIK